MPSGLLTVGCWGIQLQLTAAHYYCCQNCRDCSIWCPHSPPNSLAHPPPFLQPLPLHASCDSTFSPSDILIKRRDNQMLCLLIQFYRHEHIKGFAINDQRQAVFTVAGDWPGEFPKNVFWVLHAYHPSSAPNPQKPNKNFFFGLG